MGGSSPSFSSDDNNTGTASPDSDIYDRNNSKKKKQYSSVS